MIMKQKVMRILGMQRERRNMFVFALPERGPRKSQ